MAAIICPDCGKKISDSADACLFCGCRIARRYEPARKNRSMAIILALFLGGLGAHKFYLNRPGWGVLYLLFCWTLVPAVVSFVEALLYLTSNDEKFQEVFVQ